VLLLGVIVWARAVLPLIIWQDGFSFVILGRLLPVLVCGAEIWLIEFPQADRRRLEGSLGMTAPVSVHVSAMWR
jgi:hypothetical protein